MFALTITVHVITCFLLILIVLVQQGKGGGLIDSVSSAESIFGTKTNTFLLKATSLLSVVFFITCLTLAFLSIQRNKSLIETSYKKQPGATAPLAAQNASVTPQNTTAVLPAAQASTQEPAPVANAAQNTMAQVEKK